MQGIPRAQSRRKYSWWWDSHISPKNSRWLQENLTDMDVKVKSMIKLIEEDADSFARRAEMYYKKRPELMKLVEEFYRAYRALAERYDNATGVLRQAHRTMAEAFPNKSPLAMIDDLPENDPHTPDNTPPTRAFFGPDKVRKGLNFDNSGENEEFSEAEEVRNFEKEIQALKDALGILEAEKEAGLSQYQENLDKLHKLESEFSIAKEDSVGLNDRANKAEGEVRGLRDSIAELEAEKEASLLEYQKCLEKIANLENDVSHAKEDVVELNEQIRKAESERDDALHHYKQSLEMISNLENKLMLAEEDAKKLSDQAEKAETEVEALKQAVTKLTDENNATAILYQQCLETISILEQKLFCAEEEVQRLKGEIDTGVKKLKGAEELCLTLEESNQSLNSELESLVQKMGSQSEELTEKQKELGKLWTCLQEERFRFTEAETAFQTLQHLHSQTQEQLRYLALELENNTQLLQDMETQKESLLGEVIKIKEENKSLNELNLSSSMSMNEMQNEIVGLMESKGRLTEEVELRVDQRNALQQEIYCLKEDLNELGKKHQGITKQVDAVGLRPDDIESSVKQLQTENSELKEITEREKAEKMLYLKKLEIMEQLLEKNALLEKSLSDLTAELEGARGKINSLEESFQALLEEKSIILAEKATLLSQLQVTIENFNKLTEKNNCLENSLSDTCTEVEGLKARSKSLEDSCQLLENEKSVIINEKNSLVSQGNITQQTLEALDKRQRELEEKYSDLEKERDCTNCKLEELRVSLDAEKQEHANFAQNTDIQLVGMGKQIHLLQEEVFFRRKEFEEELDKTMNYQLEIFILQSCVEDLKEKNSSLLIECQKLIEASKLSEQLVSELKHDKLEKQVEMKSLSDQTSLLKMGMSELLKALDINHCSEDKLWEDQMYLSHMLRKIEDSKISRDQVWEHNQKMEVEKSVLVTLLGQLSLDANSLEIERNVFDQESKIKNKQLYSLRNEADKLLQLNEGLNLKVSKLTEIENKNSELQNALADLKREVDEVNVISINQENQIHKLSDENNHLSEENFCLKDANKDLEVKLEQFYEEQKQTEQLWESEATTFLAELQSSIVFRALLEEKFHDLNGKTASKDRDIDLLEEKVLTLENDNGGLKAQLAAYVPLIMSLENSISSVENVTLGTKLQNSHFDGEKEVESCKEVNACKKVPDAYSELQDLQYRLQAIEKAVIQKERLVTQDSFDANTKHEAAMRKIADLKFTGGSNKEYIVPMSDNSEFEYEILTKDIVLDQNSESSSYEVSRRGQRKSQGKMIESWDATDPDRSIDLTVGEDKKVNSPTRKGDDHIRGEMFKRQNCKRRNSEIVAEKELGVDKLQISRTISQRSQEANKTKILERLNSDVQKLTNLQITVQDLMKQIEINEKGKRGKAVYECDTLKEQLEEAEEAILELFDFNGKLMRSVEKRSFSSNMKLGTDLEESGSARRRRISEQAKKMSEKIGRLQLEIQKIQFVLVKINDEKEKENKGKSRMTEIRRRVLLRDYLYGASRTPSHMRKKKSTFCGCVQPPTRGD